MHMSYSRYARLCPCQHITFQWAAAWPRCTCARMERTFTGSGPQLVSTRRLRKAILCSWMSFTSLWELTTNISNSSFNCTEFLCDWLGFYKYPSRPPCPAHDADTNRVVCRRHSAGEGYSRSQGRRIFKVLEWAFVESNVSLPSLPFCHIGCSYGIRDHQHCQRGAIWYFIISTQIHILCNSYTK